MKCFVFSAGRVYSLKFIENEIMTLFVCEQLRIESAMLGEKMSDS